MGLLLPHTMARNKHKQGRGASPAPVAQAAPPPRMATPLASIKGALAQGSLYQYPVATRGAATSRAWVSDFGFKPGLWSSIPYRTLWTTWRAILKGPDASATVNACIRYLARCSAAVSWRVERDPGEGVWEPFPAHPLNALVKRPNPNMAMSELVARMIWHLELSGNSLCLKARGSGSQTLQLWPLIPDALYPVPDNNDYLLEYRTAPLPNMMADFPQSFAPEDIMHIQLDPDPLNQYWGQSPIESAVGIIETDRLAREWNKNALTNRTVPDGILASKMPLTEDQYNQFKDAVTAKQGPDSAREMLVLSNEVQYIPVAAMTAVDLDYIQGKKQTQQELCFVFGVPSILLTQGEGSTFENMATAREILWQDTVVPLLQKIADALNHSVASEWGPGIRIVPDYSRVPVMMQTLGRRIPMAQALFGMGVPFRTISDRLDLGIPSFPGDDVGLLPAGLMPADGVTGGDPMGGPAPSTPGTLPDPWGALLGLGSGGADGSQGSGA